MVRLVLREWQFSDGTHSFGLHFGARPSLSGLSNSKTGRKLKVTVKDAKDLSGKEKSGNTYVKLHYGKVSTILFSHVIFWVVTIKGMAVD